MTSEGAPILTDGTPESGSSGPRLNRRGLFQLMVDRRASDMFFTSFSPIKLKVEGEISPINQQVLTPEVVKQAAFALMTPAQAAEFEEERELDFAVSERGLGRFRVNLFFQRGYPAIVLRYVTADMPRIESLGLPDVVRDLALLKRGLVLVVGSAGSGKSTTLASMINFRNEHAADHILTIEDPIEFLHTNKKSIVNQREVGLDTKSFHRALRGAMRAAPDVVLIGEIRDRETMESALTLAGTGHLCLATLHANNASETLDRIINMFPASQHPQIFLDLSQYVKAIISQRLVRGREQRRVAAIEILMNTPHVESLIKRGDTVAIKEALAATSDRNMQSFDTALFKLVRDGKVTPAEALANADSRANLEARINFG